jgi:hypothetical protein
MLHGFCPAGKNHLLFSNQICTAMLHFIKIIPCPTYVFMEV